MMTNFYKLMFLWHGVPSVAIGYLISARLDWTLLVLGAMVLMAMAGHWYRVVRHSRGWAQELPHTLHMATWQAGGILAGVLIRLTGA